MVQTSLSYTFGRRGSIHAYLTTARFVNYCAGSWGFVPMQPPCSTVLAAITLCPSQIPSNSPGNPAKEVGGLEKHTGLKTVYDAVRVKSAHFQLIQHLHFIFLLLSW